MPITPLHFGLIPVLDKATKGKMSHTAFVVTNIVIDLFVILNVIQNDLNEKHGSSQRWGLHDGPDHAILGALIIGLIVWLVCKRNMAWFLGCTIGGVSHVLLDSLVHLDVSPFSPWYQGNPFYLDLMGPLSIALTIGCAWWILSAVDRLRKRRTRLEQRELSIRS